MDHSLAAAAQLRGVLELERRLVHEAIALVARGGSRRVVVGGIRFGEELLEREQELATRSGVRLVPLRSLDDSGADIAVEHVLVEPRQAVSTPSRVPNATRFVPGTASIARRCRERQTTSRTPLMTTA